MNGIIGLVTQLLVSKNLKHLDEEAAKRREKLPPLTEVQQELLAQMEKEDRKFYWAVLAIIISFALGLVLFCV